MRALLILAALALLAAPAASATAKAQSPDAPTLAEVGAQALASRFPASPDAAPERIRLNPTLAAALRAEPIPGGREKTLYLSLEGDDLILRRAIAGDRYRATGFCADCDFVQPIRGHTHPYENPFSVVDLAIASREMKPSLMVTTTGQIWLALPTGATVAHDSDIATRYALFQGRLECPGGRLAPAPADGWASPSAMGRRVELAARTAAAQFGLALYVAEPGEDFRRIAGLPPRPELAEGAVVAASDLNIQEISLLRLLHAASLSKPTAPVAWPEPNRPYPALDHRLAVPSRTGVFRTASAIAGQASAAWFSALPTTVYLTPFSDLSVDRLPFVSVQNSDDCRRVMVLDGVQTFAPDGVRYTRGWSRPRSSTAAPEVDWTPMTAADLPSGQVVPW